MRSWTIAFSLGVMLCGFIPRVPSFILILILLVASLALHCFRRLRLAAAFGLGCCWLLLYARHSLQELLPVELELEDVWVHGIVWSLPQQTERSLRFELMIERLCPLASLEACDFAALPKLRKKVLINLYQPFAVVPGQAWQLQLRLRRPHGFANPGGFDYEAWLMQKQIRATGYVRQHSANLLLHANTGQRRFDRLRAALVRKLAAVAQGELRYEHLVRALTIGDHYGISEQEWTLFSYTGTNHLIVISGLHVALAAFVLYRLGWWLGTRCTPLLLWWPAPQVASLLALGGAWFYAGLAGFSLPVQRALVMAAVLLVGRLWRRQTSALQALCLALALILLLDPLAPQNAGFWLSYCAVAVLLLTATGSAIGMSAGEDEHVPALNWLHRFWLELRTQWQVFIGLIPVMLVFFQRISVAAPLVNMPAIPWIGLLVVPLSLLAVTLMWLWSWGSLQLLKLVDWLLHLFMYSLQWWVDHAPVNLLYLPVLPAWLQGLLCLLVMTSLLAPRRWQRVVALPLIPLVFAWPRPVLPPGMLRMAVLDVGQGLAVAISTPNHHLLYDAGPWFSDRFDAGSDVVVPYLRHMNIGRLDTVIISHADADHAGGLGGVMTAFPDALYSGSDPSLFTTVARRTTCRAGQHWRWDGIDFDLLHPDAKTYGRNDGSCVLRIRVGATAILLPGDIERSVEHQLLLRGEPGRVALLVAPHHGSRTSSSPSFVAGTAPQVVVYSSGYRNRFNHPLPEVQARYAAIDSRPLLTSASGALTFDVTADGIIALREHRKTRRRFWSSPVP